jgi:class 3 adenylate cyclase/tetratricopeptide (TPR) repeat protein
VKVERSLATILFTDIVGSTERATQLGDLGWSQLLQEHHARVRREIRRLGGREIKVLGDGFLVSFPRPVQAIRCAWAIRETIRELDLQVRSGLHFGEIEHHAGDLGGIAVHIGSRIAAMAAPGEILVSNTVREMEMGSGFRFMDRGKHELRGVSGEWQLFALESLLEIPKFRSARWVPPLKRRHARIAAGASFTLLLVILGGWIFWSRTPLSTISESNAVVSAAPAIAVLPFRVQGERAEILREGMVDLLSTGLDQATSIRAINPATMLARWREAVAEGEEPELSTRLAIARRTGSRYAVVGSAVVVGSEIRLTATVYDLQTGDQLGQGQAEGGEDAVLQLADRLAVEVLRIVLQRGEDELPQINMASLTTDSPEALRAYLEGEVHFRHFDLQAATEAYKRAVERDSTFALAHYRLADTYLWPGNIGDPSYNLEQALVFSDRLPSRERILVKALHALEERSPDAIESLRQLVSRHPEGAEGWYLLADTYLHVPGAFATAEEIAQMFERSVDLDPKNAKYLLHHVQFAWWHEADSAAAAQRVELYEQVAPRHPLGRAGRLAIALAFGDSITREGAMSRLRQEEDYEVVADVRRFLYHPRYSALPGVLEELPRHVTGEEVPLFVEWSQRSLFRYWALWHGQLQRGRTYLGDVHPALRAALLYEAKIAGMPIPEAELETLAVIDNAATGWEVFFGGALAAETAHWSDHARAMADLRKREERALRESDTFTAQHFQQSARILDAHRSWRQGDHAAALPTLMDPQTLTRWTDGPGDLQVGSLWLGQLYQDSERFGEARRVYGSFHFLNALSDEPLSQYQLGRIHEKLREYDKAIASYEYFIEHWKYADVELQTMVNEARQAVIRLRGLQRE